MFALSSLLRRALVSLLPSAYVQLTRWKSGVLAAVASSQRAAGIG